MEEIINWLKSLDLINKLLPFAFILVGGIIIVRIIIVIINRALKRSKLEKAAHSLIKSVTQIILYTLIVLAALSSIGIDVTGIVAFASVASLAISLSLQNALTNIIGGFTLLNTRPFKSGDWVEIAGQSGTVNEIGMAYTKLTTADNKLVQIPNANVVASEIVNYTSTGTRRIAIDVNVSYDAPTEKVLSCLTEAASVDKIRPEEGVFTTPTGFGEQFITYTVRVWCATDDYWDINYEIIKNIKTIFDREGISLSYSNLNVTIKK